VPVPVQHDVDRRCIEIVSATRSPTKFIVTDDPVTFYCKRSSQWSGSTRMKMSLKQIGTRTIFAARARILPDHHALAMIRNPWAQPAEFRVDPRSFQTRVRHLGQIQYGRELEQDEVLRVNYILKRRAVRYIAAAEQEWLYPDWRHVQACHFHSSPSEPFLELVPTTRLVKNRLRGRVVRRSPKT
jgi:hypothetical protein